MPPSFIRNFKKHHECVRCGSSVEEASLCQKHLRQARAKFRIWSRRRKGAGLCIRCDRKAYNGWLRCKTHTEENRANCLKWMKANRQELDLTWEKRKQEALKTGICPYCRKNKSSNGALCCEKCRQRRRSHEKKRGPRNRSRPR